jgi:hypothetical protein
MRGRTAVARPSPGTRRHRGAAGRAPPASRGWRAAAYVLGASLAAATPAWAEAERGPQTTTASTGDSSTTTTAAALAWADEVFDDLAPKTSLRVLSDEEAWSSGGFRVGLGYALEGLLAPDPVPAGVVHAALLRLGARLDADWSLLGTFRYGVLPGAPPMLRFSGTIEPTLHLGDALSLGIGLGLGGVVHPDTGARTPEPVDPLIASLTLPDTTQLLGACSGTGVIATLRAEYTFLVGELFATGPALTADVQWTACVETLTRVDPDTGAAIVLRQYWRHASLGASWMVWWR